MRIYNNQYNINDLNGLLDDPAILHASKLWSKEELYKTSTIELSIFNTPFGSISLLYGLRQIGKTASLKLFLSRVTDSETIIFTDCSMIKDRVDLYKYLSALIKGPTTIVLDEVQVVPEWHLALRALYSENKLTQCRIWCTGSEARYLIESGERLPGRKGAGIVVFARPWSFREVMDFLHPEETTTLKKLNFKHVTQEWLLDQELDWQKYWSDYCLTGGLPQVVAEYAKTGFMTDAVWVVYADWILGSWSNLRTHERSLRALCQRICATMNSRVSFEALKKGTDILSPLTIRSLVEMQEDHFALHTVPRYNIAEQKFLPVKLKKIYPSDPFIARVFAALGEDVRRLFSENTPTLPLDECAFSSQFYRWANGPELGYAYSDRTKAEVDFYFEGCGFELKTNGVPTGPQKALLQQCSQAFALNKQTLPIMAYLVGEGR